MSAAHAPAVEPHAFTPSGRIEIDARGRRLSICATCGRRRIGTTHSAAQPATIAGFAELPERRHKPAPAPERQTRRRPELVIPSPRELIELALMLDAVIELPPELIGWRVHLRSQELRKAIPEIPPSRPARAPEARDESGGTMPASPPSRARSGGAGASHAEPSKPAAQELTHEPTLIEHAPRSAQSRARELSKRIQDPRLRELAGRAIVAGWSLERTGSGHWKLKHGPSSLVFGQTPSDRRSWMNARARARRLGIDVEGIS